MPDADSVISIYNMLGEKVMDVPALFSGGGQETEIDVSGLQAGVYFLELLTDETIFRAKFVRD